MYNFDELLETTVWGVANAWSWNDEWDWISVNKTIELYEARNWWSLIEATKSTCRFTKLLLDKFCLAGEGEGKPIDSIAIYGKTYHPYAVAVVKNDTPINYDTQAGKGIFMVKNFWELSKNLEIQESFNQQKNPAIGYHKWKYTSLVL